MGMKTVHTASSYCDEKMVINYSNIFFITTTSDSNETMVKIGDSVVAWWDMTTPCSLIGRIKALQICQTWNKQLLNLFEHITMYTTNNAKYESFYQ